MEFGFISQKSKIDVTYLLLGNAGPTVSPV